MTFYVLFSHLCVFFGGINIQSFYSFWKSDFFSFCYWVVWVTYHILDINLLVDTCCANIFFYFIGCIFISLIISFAVKKIFVWSSPTCLFMLLLLVLLVSHPKNHCWDECQGAFSPKFSSRWFTVSGFTFKSLIHFS